MEYPQYNPQSDNRPLSDGELSDLDDLLAELPSDSALNIEALDGTARQTYQDYLTADREYRQARQNLIDHVTHQDWQAADHP